MSYGLSKSRLMAFHQCPKRLWLHVHRRDLQVFSSATEQRFQIGFQVGEITWSLHPDGLLIETDDPAEALEQTRQALTTHPYRPLFEAAFQRDGVLIRADVLLPEPGGYRLREVKASTSVKDEHVLDCAIQAWVVSAAITLTGVELAHVDNTFVYPGGGDYRGLLKSNPLDRELNDRLPLVPGWISAARTMLAAAEPTITPGDQCHTPYECPFLDHCTAGQTQPEYPLDCLPRLQGQRRAGLIEQGITDVRNIPNGYPLTAHQARVTRAIQTGEATLAPQTAALMRQFGYPRYHMDFETVQMAVPLWPGTRPYQQLPVQWSCHRETAGGELTHAQFMAKGLTDPRRAFTEQLIKTLGNTGPVFVYNSGFEKRCLQELAAEYPDLQPKIHAILGRVVDLLPLVRQHYDHPALRGRVSLKAVLPTIAPDLAYDDLAIGDGGAACAAWREIYHPDTLEERRATLYTALPEYCALDTMALVRLAHFLS